MFIKTKAKTLFQIFYDFVLYSAIIFKRIIDPDDSTLREL